MSFKDAALEDLHDVFLNTEEFADVRTVIYDGVRYEDIPIVLTGLKESDRAQNTSDHAQGLYLVTSVLHCALSDLSGNQPEKGMKIRINDAKGGIFFREYYVASSVVEHGMIRCELEGIDE